MRRSTLGDRIEPRAYWRRIERAAGEMIPYLVALAIGLAILNLTCLAMLAAQQGVTRRSPDAVCAPSQAVCGVAPGIEARLTSGS